MRVCASVGGERGGGLLGRGTDFRWWGEQLFGG